MREPEAARASAAAVAIAASMGLAVDDALVLQSSNTLALRLVPADVLVRIGPVGSGNPHRELELARRLADAGSPVAALAPRVEASVHERDGFAATLWTYYDPATSPEVTPAGYAHALARLHHAMPTVDIRTPHFADRVAEARQIVGSRDRSPALTDDDRHLLATTLRSSSEAIRARGVAEQLLHGEPHAGNVLGSGDGPVFIDLETCCRGPVEFDVAHVPEEVSDLYASCDRELLGDCRRLVLAMVAAWRWDAADEFPDGPRAGRALLAALRAGPPWPTADAAGE